MSTIDQSQLQGFLANTTVSNAGGGGGVSGGGKGNWMRALAESGMRNLDAQASKITSLSDSVGSGADKPSDMIAVTVAAMEMNFKSNSVSTQLNSASQAMEALAKRS
ncbi:hypothetical protein [Luteimonas aquatica]|uniref:hypothetical protein n=1 Tax=Luteimonas aquatica TaxID=450364 RepID=UPI001F571168|nr:hypothetical protein [Luteimonas aquatica]